MSFEIIEVYYNENRQRLVKKYAFVMGCDALGEDVVQESFYRACRYIDNYTPREPIGKWITRILKNVVIDFKNEEKHYGGGDYEDEDSYDCPAYSEQINKEIVEMISTKKDFQRDILNLYFLNGYSAKDVASVTEYSYAQTHQTIQRFRNELKERYKE